MSSWKQGTTKCSANNGGCSHLCLNRPNGLDPVCACPSGFTLSPNGTCIPPPAFLIYSCRFDIQTISLADFSHSVVPLSGIEDAGSLDYLYAEERIFWADTKIGAISRAFINGSDVRRIVEVGVKYLEGMAQSFGNDPVDGCVECWWKDNLAFSPRASTSLDRARFLGRSLDYGYEDDRSSLSVDFVNRIFTQFKFFLPSFRIEFLPIFLAGQFTFGWS
jgi:hypothetical protein